MYTYDNNKCITYDNYKCITCTLTQKVTKFTIRDICKDQVELNY